MNDEQITLEVQIQTEGSENLPALIEAKQLPVIQERLREFKATVQRRVDQALSLECTEENLASVRAERAKLRKEYEALEFQRKQVEAQIMAPIEEFRKTYKECAESIIKSADNEMKERISSVENEIKGRREAELREYFTELCEANGVQWLKFEQANLKIDLTAARAKNLKKLREQLVNFVSKVSKSVELISDMEFADEIMAEYRKCLDATQSISIIHDRHARIKEERAFLQRRADYQESVSSAVEKVDAVLPPKEEPVAPVSDSLSPPTVSEVEDKNEPVHPCFFKVTATLSKLRKLKEFMVKEGICYEQ